MNTNKIKIVDNVIYTLVENNRPVPKGVGIYHYDQMMKYKDKLAQIDGSTKEEDTFGCLLQRAVRTALKMVDKGLKPGDFISLCSYNHLNAAVPHIASFLTGTIMSAVEPSMTVEEAVYCLKQTMPKIIFVTLTEIPLIEKVVERLGNNAEIVVFGESTLHTPFANFLEPHKNENLFRPIEIENLNTVAFVVFSSGTTGMPKGICHTHHNMLYISMENFPTTINALCCIANLYWSLSIAYLHNSITFGFVRILYPKFDVEEPWSMYYQHVDVGFFSTFQALHMIRSKKPDKADLKNVKGLYIGGNPLSRKDIEELQLSLPYTSVIPTYGQSEVFRRIFLPAGSELSKNNVCSVGTVMPGNNYKVVDLETRKVLGPNQIGELLIKSPAQFVGYLNQDYSECFDSHGWLKTGDLFYYNADLLFYVVDRVKESFKFKQYHISPVEIETVILKLQAVENVVVIGIPHETECNHPVAIVKLKSNAGMISAENIINHVEDNLDDKKRLRAGVKFVDSFPITVTGKVNRFKLKKMILNHEI